MYSFKTLGPLEARCGKKDLKVREGQTQQVLACLLMNSGKVVSRNRMAQFLREGTILPSWDKCVQTHVSHTRKDLGDIDKSLIESVGTGYRINITREQLDLLVFEDLVKQGRAAVRRGNYVAAAAILREALDLWYGNELLEGMELPFCFQPDAEHVRNLRLDTVQDWATASMHLGRHHDVIPELDTLAVRHPEREHLTETLMHALYLDGRRQDALNAYAREDRALRKEFGYETGHRLDKMQSRILSDDPTLDYQYDPGSAAR